MRAHKPLIAFLLLLGWLFATGHVALRHGAVADGGGHHAFVGDGEDDDHDDHDAPSRDLQHHHHDLTVVADGQAARWELTVLAPGWLPLYDAFIERLTPALRDPRQPQLLAGLEHSPPDQRASGWLLVLQTALPVRGPSLVV